MGDIQGALGHDRMDDDAPRTSVSAKPGIGETAIQGQWRTPDQCRQRSSPFEACQNSPAAPGSIEACGFVRGEG